MKRGKPLAGAASNKRKYRHRAAGDIRLADIVAGSLRAAPPVQAAPLLSGHRPTPHRDGSLACSGGGCNGHRYSPGAYAAHLANKPPRESTLADDGAHVYLTGPGDEWEAARIRARSRPPESIDPTGGAERRAELIEEYQAERKRARPRVVDGTSAWMTD